MDVKTLLLCLVLCNLTIAYLVVSADVKAAKPQGVSHHSHRMIAGCTIVGIWLAAYVLKLSMFGGEPGRKPRAW